MTTRLTYARRCGSSDMVTLRALLAVDDHDDIEHVLRALRAGGFEVEHARVVTAADFREAVTREPWDVVIADHTLPSFSAPQAFVIARQEESCLPFIVVSGAVGEETAVAAMRHGIDDYLMKDKLERLPDAVKRAIQASRKRRQRKRAEETARQRDAILLAVGLAAKRLLTADDWRVEVQEVVTQLGKAAAVSRVNLFSFRGKNHARATQEAEWVAPGIAPRAGTTEFMNFDLGGVGFESIRELEEGRYIEGRPGDFPPPVQFRLESWDVASLAVMPIMVDGKLWGTIGFDVCRAPRNWSRVEIEALKVAADTMGAAIKRVEAKATLRRQMAHLSALRTIDQAIINSLDLKLTLDVVLDQVTTYLRVDAARVLLLDPVTQELDLMAATGFLGSELRQGVLRVGEGCAGRVALSRQPLCVPDLRRAAAAEGYHDVFMPPGFFSYYAQPLIAKNQVKGVLETFCRTAVDSDDEWCGFAATLADQAAIAIDNARMLASLTKSNTELRLAYETTLEGWSRALDLRDTVAQGNTARLAGLTVLLGHALGMDTEEMLHLRRGALLHDIGKMGIPDAILLKPGPLTDEEWEVMRRHPVYGYELLSPISYLRPALDIPHLHHERWDGSGYPLGLKGEEIPLSARVFAVVDTWDAMTSNRPYRRRVSEERARQIIRESAGTDFDPRIVEVFLKLDLSLGKPAARNTQSG